MNTLAEKLPGRQREQWSRVLLVLFAVVILTFSIPPIWNCVRGVGVKDYVLWYETGRIVLQGGDIYPMAENEVFQFLYPPPAAILLAPLSALGQLGLTIILGAVNSVSWAVCVFLAVYLATGRAFKRSPLLYYVVPVACCAPFVWGTYLLGQPNLLLLACMLGMFACLRHKNDWGAGALLAAAAAIKAFPILAVVWLMYRRHWKATAFTIAFLGFFVLVFPAPVRGFQRNLEDVKTWSTRMAFNYHAGSFAQRTTWAYGYKNQSLMGVVNRLLRHVNAADADKEQPVVVNVADLSFQAVNAVIMLIGLALSLFYAFTMPPRGQRTTDSDAIEYAMLLLLILIFSPLVFEYFYVWLLYPLVVAMNFLLSAPHPSRQRMQTLLWIVACMFLIGLKLLWPGPYVAEALGNYLWACLLLFVGFGWKLRRLRHADTPASVQPASGEAQTLAQSARVDS